MKRYPKPISLRTLLVAAGIALAASAAAADPKVKVDAGTLSGVAQDGVRIFKGVPFAARALNCADGFNWPAYTAETDAIAVFGEKPELKKAAELPKFVPPPPAQPST